MVQPGRIVVLNGTPRSGKSSIATAMQDTLDGPWVNLGVDVSALMIPTRYRPGIGLRPGGERPDLEDTVVSLFAALYESVAAHSRLGLDVVVDVGHHDSYSQPRHILRRAAAQLTGLPAWLVGVRCPLGVIMQRRDAGEAGREDAYLTSTAAGEVPPPVLRWQREAHTPGIYDVEVDTSRLTPVECAGVIARRLRVGPGPSAFRRLAAH